jgi:hypothetical protein
MPGHGFRSVEVKGDVYWFMGDSVESVRRAIEDGEFVEAICCSDDR